MRASKKSVMPGLLVIGALASLGAMSVLADIKGPGHHGPPPEAIDACADAAAGDACTFQGRDGEVSGTCRTPPGHADELVCVPAGHRPPPPPPDGGGQ